jgi:hypothetical protein
VQYFEGIPGVSPIHLHQNPATWMLETIGAGTGPAKESVTDFHIYYKQSSLHQAVQSKVNALSASQEPLEKTSPATSSAVTTAPYLSIASLTELSQPEPVSKYNVSYSTQFYWLLKRAALSYWRSPGYNLVRLMISVVIALIFASAYAHQHYSSDVEVVSRCAVMYVTLLFVGVVGMTSVQPVVFSERPAFFRERFSQVYSVSLHTLVGTLVELPYLLFSSLLFVVPFFFIVGFDNIGTVPERFFFYWLFQGLYMCTLVFIGQFYAALMPTPASSQIVSGMTSTFLSLFAGFMIPSQSMPTFWLFVYWINPLHYALEGLFTTQFSGDHTAISQSTGSSSTAREYVSEVFKDWSYHHRWYDVGALLLFIIFLRLGTYLSSKYLRHDKR